MDVDYSERNYIYENISLLYKTIMRFQNVLRKPILDTYYSLPQLLSLELQSQFSCG